MEMTKYNKKKPSGMAKNGNGDDSAKARYQSMHAKCMNQGREAALHGDAVEAERFFQQAEHYLRIMNNAQEKKAKAASSQAEQMLQGEKMAPPSEKQGAES